MRRFRVNVAVLVVVLAATAAACSSSSKTSTPATTTAPVTTTTAATPAAAIPTATTISQPVTYGYYDGHVDWMLSTDVSSKTQAASSHINYSAALLLQPARRRSLRCTSSADRRRRTSPWCSGASPAKTTTRPLWREITVKWKPGVTPVLLVKDDQINSLAAKGQLTAVPTNVVLNCPIVKVTAATTVPTATTISQPVTYGYYDGHVDTMLSTDVSSKAAGRRRVTSTTRPPSWPSPPARIRRCTWSPDPPHRTSRWCSGPSPAKTTTRPCGARSP